MEVEYIKKKAEALVNLTSVGQCTQNVSFHLVSPPTPVYASPLPHTCYMPSHLILLDLITQTILCEQYRSLSSSLRSFLHSPVTSSLLGPNILLNTLFSNTPHPTFLPQCERPSFTPIQSNRQNYNSIYHNL